MLLLLKSKLKEANSEKERLLSHIEALEARLKGEDGVNNTFPIDESGTKYFYKDDTKNEFNKSSQTNQVNEAKIENYESSLSLQKLKKDNNLPSLEEFTYILIKNFEGYEISKEQSNKTIFNGINTEKDFPKLVQNIASSIHINSDEEKELLNYYLTSILNLKQKNMFQTVNYIKDLFENITFFSTEEKAILSSKIRKHLLPVFDKFMSNVGNKKQITFFTLREILYDLQLTLKEKYTEYLIYFMKSNIKNDNRIFNLDVTELQTLILSQSEISKNEISADDDNYSEEAFAQFLITVNNYLQGKSLIKCFGKDNIYKPETKDGEKLDSCVDFNIFIDFLYSKVKIQENELDVKMIFERYCIDDEYNLISIDQLQNDLLQLAGTMTFNKKQQSPSSLNIVHENSEEMLDSDKKSKLLIKVIIENQNHF